MDGSEACESRYPCVRGRVNVTEIEGGEEAVVMSNVTLYDSYETYCLQHHTHQVVCATCNTTHIR